MRFNKLIPIIDLFAGPGGLGEGFSSLENTEGKPCFRIKLSIENDQFAHKTLELRSFFRQFRYEAADVPEDYYKYLRGEIQRDKLFENYKSQFLKAASEARKATLGEKVAENDIDRWIEEAIGSYSRGKKPWVLIGGPPCQAYSVAGRSRNKGIDGYVPEKDNRHFLYKEYLRIIANHWPSVFVMENVKGLITAKVRNEHVFKNILNDLKNPGSAIFGENNEKGFKYHIFPLVIPSSIKNDRIKPKDFIVESERYGIPQARHRVFIIGIREDFTNIKPACLIPSTQKITVSDVIADLPHLRSGLSQEKDSSEKWKKCLIESQKKTRWLDSILKSPNNGNQVYYCLLSTLKNLKLPKHDRGKEFLSCKLNTAYRADWFNDDRIGGICNHVSRTHIAKDLIRYLYASCFAHVNGWSPKLKDFPGDLLPKHKNVRKALKKNEFFSDRFRVQIFEKASTTITSHISKDGHYYIHPDPEQCRSLTV